MQQPDLPRQPIHAGAEQGSGAAVHLGILHENGQRQRAAPLRRGDGEIVEHRLGPSRKGLDRRSASRGRRMSRQGQRRTAPPLQVLRTGTDNVPFNVPTLHSAVTGPGVATVGASQPDYGGMAVPSVWRTNRTQAAAKVDALSSGGMDDFEIPAFLRKQAD